MTRFAAVLFSVLAVPAVAAAQAPQPRPDPRPFVVPVPPVPPVPPTPVVAPVPPVPPVPPPQPVPFGFDPLHGNFDDLKAHFREMADVDGLTSGPVKIARDLARASADASREAAAMARDMAQWPRLEPRSMATEFRYAFDQGQDGRDVNKDRMSDGYYHGSYNRALDAFQRRQYASAIQAFDVVITGGGVRVDASLYWKAFAQFRLGQRDNALATIALLRKDHAQSRYLTDARVLEADVRKQSGQTIDPSQIDNDEIKLLAIQGLQRTEQVVPLLQEVLTGANSLAVKKRALYVLALNDDARAQQVLLQYAKGAGTPDLQVEAIRYLAVRQGAQTIGPTLREVYGNTSDATIKREIINAFGTLRPALSASPDSDGKPLRFPEPREANTSVTAAQKDLAILFQGETDVDLRGHIAGTLAVMGAGDQIVPLMRNEKDKSVQQRAVRALGGRRDASSTQALLDLYGSLADLETREVVVGALAAKRDAASLVTLARKETNLRLKTTIVRHLSGMANQSKVASDYLAEVLK